GAASRPNCDPQRKPTRADAGPPPPPPPPAEAAEFLERANEEQTHANDLAGLLEAIEGAPG
ncbi:MAG: hypothetical protein OXG03_05330, partial [Gammaproteobacteria bacterium]|nr:hypothetical protein [Gammaproteobacteria bacterium]